MIDFKKHWTTILGIVFFLVAFIYLLRLSLDSNWMTPTVKIIAGLIFAAGLLIAGVQLVLRKSEWVGQLLAGSGLAVLITTFAYAGIFQNIWSPTTVFIAMIATTLVLSVYAYIYGLRILMNIALLGGLIAPLLLRSDTDQVFTLFLYLLVLNIAGFFMAVQKRWEELYVIVFSGSWLLYAVYWIHIGPEVNSWFALPIRYALAAFLFYVVAISLAGWVLRKTFDGLNLYLGVVNALLFTFWALVSYEMRSTAVDIINDGVVILFVGFVYLILSAVMYGLNKEIKLPLIIYMSGGWLLVLLSANQLLDGTTHEVLYLVFIWLFVSYLFYALSRWKSVPFLEWVAHSVWFLVGIYWFVTTWDTPRGEWFGVYIPFLNSGALAWMVMAGLGFYYSNSLRKQEVQHEDYRKAMEYITALSAHLMVGGLLTVQIRNIWEEYALNQDFESLTLSISWGVYALLLFLWGAYSRQNFFKIFGSVVLVFVAIKAIFIDLAGSETYYKVIVLLVLGVISFAITFINNRWKEQPPVEKV